MTSEEISLRVVDVLIDRMAALSEAHATPYDRANGHDS